jgi:hypothetical protein
MHSPKVDKSGVMVNRSEFVERRKFERFQVSDGGVALVTPPGPYSTVVGDIMDINMAGLSFRYVSDQTVSEKASELTIASPEHEIYLRNLPIETISDFEMAKMPFGSMSPRRHSLKFGELTEEQTSHLEHFIMNHTADVP